MGKLAVSQGHVSAVGVLIAAGAVHLELALDLAKRNRRTGVAQFLEKKIEDLSATRPLQLFCSMDSASMTVTCVNMVGDKLAQLTLNPDATFRALADMIHEQLPTQVGRWT